MESNSEQQRIGTAGPESTVPDRESASAADSRESPPPGDIAAAGEQSDPDQQIPSESSDSADAQQPGSARRPPSRPGNADKLSRVTLGSAFLAVDTVNERLDRLDEESIQDRAPQRTLEDVLVPVSDWQEQFGVIVDRPTRHLMLGMMVDARSRAGKTAGMLNRVGNGLALVIDRLLRPVRTNRLFRPVRRGYDKAVDRGDSQVRRWRAMGREEEARNRALAQTALSDAAEETMDEIADNPRIEFFIQEIVESQTMGIVDEIIEEIRERSVSSDNFFERPVRRLLRKPERSEVPGPDFDPRLVRPLARRGSPIREGSLLGNYAGFVSRLLALVVDVGLIVLILALGSSLLSTVINVLDLREWFDSVIGNANILTTGFAAINGMVIVVGYLILFWMLTGQTLGMMLLGLRVVTRTGGHIPLWRALLRMVGYILLPVIFFLGFLWILGDDKRQAWHDKLAGTIVVYAWDARPDETFLTYGMYMND